MELEQIANRVAADPVIPEEREETPEDVPEKEVIKWKTLPKYLRNLKLLLKDADAAIKERKNIELFRTFGEIIDILGLMAKATNQRNVKTKLDTIEKIFKG